jgi:polyisoprenoid-binding protein YceI
VDVLIDATSLWADNEKLTGHLKSADFFEVETYPQARFQSTHIVQDGEQYRVSGNLTLHGITRSVTFPAAIEFVAGERIRARAEFAIKRFDWSIEYKGKADDLIRDDVVIKLDLEATPGDAAGAPSATGAGPEPDLEPTAG